MTDSRTQQNKVTSPWTLLPPAPAQQTVPCAWMDSRMGESGSGDGGGGFGQCADDKIPDGFGKTIGLFLVLATLLACLPQVLKLIKSKSSDGVAPLTMCIIFLFRCKRPIIKPVVVNSVSACALLSGASSLSPPSTRLHHCYLHSLLRLQR